MASKEYDLVTITHELIQRFEEGDDQITRDSWDALLDALTNYVVVFASAPTTETYQDKKRYPTINLLQVLSANGVQTTSAQRRGVGHELETDY
ncbi:MAG: hypothetical protein ABI425_04905 [Patescibacteria group bacterium]